MMMVIITFIIIINYGFFFKKCNIYLFKYKNKWHIV